MTPRIPTLRAAGTVTRSLADKSSGDVYLKFDPAPAAATFEMIELKDYDLRRIWGESLYRVLLTSSEPTSAGTWKIEIV
jgi:hypothetical protein